MIHLRILIPDTEGILKLTLQAGIYSHSSEDRNVAELVGRELVTRGVEKD